MNTNDWVFEDPHGTFSLSNPQAASYLYFPLINEAGMMASVSPYLNGDAKADHSIATGQYAGWSDATARK